MKPFRLPRFSFALLLFASPMLVKSAEPKAEPPRPADAMLAEYFRARTAKLAERCLAEVKSLDDWERLQPRYRQQLFEMLGLDPLPARTDLKPVVTGKVERDDFVVENLHFQSSPGLYVTANLYLPKNLPKPAPTILYLSGHGPVISNGVSYGNKVAYQHHGAWFARNGYICLVLDTLQLGEIQGLHHGTYREGMWWWNSRGYTSAGVEAWNSIRALDYLSTRPEVDTNRFGATGRSGGGAYSWWIATLDDRIKAVAPVAGITDLQNHVVDGCVEGHCDCMFTVNTYAWDYPQVAALVAPRPLLIVNTDADSIFPLDGVQRTHALVRRIYQLHRAPDKLGLVIGPGPHKDTQDLQVPVFRWFNKHLKGEDPTIEMAATKFFTPQELKVFATLPTDALNTNIHDSFVPMASKPALPDAKEAWMRQRDGWLAALKQKTFAGWPDERVSLRLEEKTSATRQGLKLQTFEFDSEPHARLRCYAVSSAGLKRATTVSLRVVDEAEWRKELATMRAGFAQELAEEFPTPGAETKLESENAFAVLRQTLKDNKTAIVFFAPRGIGSTAWSGDARKQTQIRRRFMLLGQTLDGMRVWDIRRACQAVRSLPFATQSRLELLAREQMAANVVMASLFEPRIDGLVLSSPPKSFREGPDYLNALRVLDLPAAVAMAAERTAVKIETDDSNGLDFPVNTASRLGWDKSRLEIRLSAGQGAK